MEKSLYKIRPEEPSRGCRLEQVRPVQGLNLSPGCRACARPPARSAAGLAPAEGPSLSPGLSSPFRGAEAGPEQAQSRLSPLHLAVLRRLRVQAGEDCPRREQRASGGSRRGCDKTAVAVEAQAQASVGPGKQVAVLQPPKRGPSGLAPMTTQGLWSLRGQGLGGAGSCVVRGGQDLSLAPFNPNPC